MVGVPKVSLICTVRDEARHVGLALASALDQPVDEVVIVDDGSADGTPGVLRAIVGGDARVRVVTTAAAGRGPALRRAMCEARGDIVVNLDADDVLHPDWIRVGLAALAANASLAVVAARPRYIRADDRVAWPGLSGAPALIDVTAQLPFHNPLVHSSAMMWRARIDEVGGYQESRRRQFDYDLWIRLARAGGRVGVINAPLVGKRLHCGQKFERHHRLSYLHSSLVTQAQAIRVLGGGRGAWVSLAARLGWGLLPRAVRMTARRVISQHTPQPDRGRSALPSDRRYDARSASTGSTRAVSKARIHRDTARDPTTDVTAPAVNSRSAPAEITRAIGR